MREETRKELDFNCWEFGSDRDFEEVENLFFNCDPVDNIDMHDYGFHSVNINKGEIV